jgi:hypothetical protein
LGNVPAADEGKSGGEAIASAVLRDEPNKSAKMLWEELLEPVESADEHPANDDRTASEAMIGKPPRRPKV